MGCEFQSPLVVSLCDFVQSIGLPVLRADLPQPTFLPGLTILNGKILLDESRLLYPGDLLHEAGHLAVLPPAERANASAPLEGDPGLEMGAIAWSWAALTHLHLDPYVVFHSEGYKGAAESLVENFSAGRYLGVPLLQWMGMTTGQTFPEMSCWLRPEGSQS